MPADKTDNVEDADLQAALKMSLGEQPVAPSSADDEDIDAAMLAQAIKLSMQETSSETLLETVTDNPGRTTLSGASHISFEGFVLGRDYPFPILEPVSLRGSESVADEARAAQQQRDVQIAQSESRRSTRGGAKICISEHGDLQTGGRAQVSRGYGSEDCRPEVHEGGKGAEDGVSEDLPRRCRWGKNHKGS